MWVLQVWVVCVGRTLLPPTPLTLGYVLGLQQEKSKKNKSKIKGVGQECPTHTINGFA